MEHEPDTTPPPPPPPPPPPFPGIDICNRSIQSVSINLVTYPNGQRRRIFVFGRGNFAKDVATSRIAATDVVRKNGKPAVLPEHRTPVTSGPSTMASRNSILRGLVALALILVVNADAEIKMKKLSYKEFTPFRTGSQEVLILFQRGAFAPPEIEEAATALVEQIPSAWVDCDWSKAKKICKELEIETFPSLVFFADKNDDQDYYTIDINRKASEIVEDVRGRLSGKTVVHKKSAEVAPSERVFTERTDCRGAPIAVGGSVLCSGLARCPANRATAICTSLDTTAPASGPMP